MAENCDHPVVEAASDCTDFVCSECGEAVVLRTKWGTIITPDEIDRWVLQAETAYRMSKTPPERIEDDDGCPND